MATPRKHWFRVPDSILDEGWPDEIVATLMRLQSVMNRRWARNGLTAEQAATIELSPAALAEVTNRRRRDVAEKLATSLQDVTSISVEHLGYVTRITWNKWPKFQELGAREKPEVDPGNSLSANADANAPAQKKKTNTPCSTADAVSPSVDDPARWVHVLGKEPGSEEEKLAFVTRELPLAQAEAEEHHSRDRKAQRGKIRSVLIRHYRWQRANPAPARASPRGPQRPVTFADQARQNTDDAFRGAFEVITRERGDHGAEPLEPGTDRGAIDVPAAVLLRDRH